MRGGGGGTLLSQDFGTRKKHQNNQNRISLEFVFYMKTEVPHPSFRALFVQLVRVINTQE